MPKTTVTHHSMKVLEEAGRKLLEEDEINAVIRHVKNVRMLQSEGMNNSVKHLLLLFFFFA